VRVVETGAFARAAERMDISSRSSAAASPALEEHWRPASHPHRARAQPTDIGQAYYARGIQHPADLSGTGGVTMR
jgi:DNA-binding transcriptional LysR family regulator